MIFLFRISMDRSFFLPKVKILTTYITSGTELFGKPQNEILHIKGLDFYGGILKNP